MSNLKRVFNLKGFDPLEVDTTYIEETCKKIPKDGHLDLHEAERLATTFLRCSDSCGETLSTLALYKGHQSALLKAAKAKAIANKITNEGMTQTLAREAYYDDQAFLEASARFNRADAAYQWFEQKYQNLLKAHVLCKDIFKLHKGNEQLSGWQGEDPDEGFIPKDNRLPRADDAGATDDKHIGEVDW